MCSPHASVGGTWMVLGGRWMVLGGCAVVGGAVVVGVVEVAIELAGAVLAGAVVAGVVEPWGEAPADDPVPPGDDGGRARPGEAAVAGLSGGDPSDPVARVVAPGASPSTAEAGAPEVGADGLPPVDTVRRGWGPPEVVAATSTATIAMAATPASSGRR